MYIHIHILYVSICMYTYICIYLCMCRLVKTKCLPPPSRS